MKMSEILFNRYEYLSKKYAGKIFSYYELSYEYEDLVQEFRIKIFTSIKSYGRRWAAYRRGDAVRPVPIRYYLEAACSNKANDLIRNIKQAGYKVRIDSVRYDYGIENDTQISPNENKFIVHGIDLLEGLRGLDKILFSLFLKGFNFTMLSKVYSNKTAKKVDGEKKFKTPRDLVDFQVSFLKNKYGNELNRQSTVYSVYQAVNED